MAEWTMRHVGFFSPFSLPSCKRSTEGLAKRNCQHDESSCFARVVTSFSCAHVQDVCCVNFIMNVLWLIKSHTVHTVNWGYALKIRRSSSEVTMMKTKKLSWKLRKEIISFHPKTLKITQLRGLSGNSELLWILVLSLI